MGIRIVVIGWLAILSVTSAHAGITLGGGPITPIAADNAPGLLIFDANYAVLSEGAYRAERFGHRFSSSQGLPSGSVKPVVLSGDPLTGELTILAIGSPVAYSGNTDFVFTDFGGSDTFTIPTEYHRFVYGAFYWDGVGGGRSPIGYQFASDHFDRTEVGAGFSPLSIGQVIPNGVITLSLARKYDYLIEISPAFITTPEPATLVSMGIGSIFVGIGFRTGRNRSSRRVGRD